MQIPSRTRMENKNERIAKELNVFNEHYQKGLVSADDATQDYMFTTQIKYETGRE